ncbi:MAG: hypothetical protein LBN35_03440 [Clostridiales Family XIII bacterium]|jgi:hypothetical protein|nr:hypothetical protein [Clostridiales Family XIII bacterium]
MFMEKIEWQNTLNLLKIRLTGMRGLKWVLILLPVILFIKSTLGSISEVKNNALTFNGFISLSDSSGLFIVFILVWVIVIKCTNNDRTIILDAFPQTNVSRFLSMEILILLVALYAGVVSLIINLLNYIIASAISSAYPDVVIINPLNIAEQVSGFLLYLLLLVFQITFISLITALLKKIRYVTFVILIAVSAFIISLLFINIPLPPHIQDAFRDYRATPLVPVIFLILSVLLFFGTLYCHKHMASYRADRPGYHTVISAVSAVILIIGLSPSMLILNSVYPNANTERMDNDKVSRLHEEIVIDASSVPEGSKLSIEPKSFSDQTPGIYEVDYSTDYDPMADFLLDYDQSEFDNFSGKQITLSITYPYKQGNGYDLCAPAKPGVTAKLDGSTLYLDYSYKEIIPIVMESWNYINSTSSGNGPGQVELTVG